jgi:dihydroorotate dehydrogenase (fumarate)
MDLSTTYLGLKLSHPFIVGASPLSATLDGVRRLEDGGAAAVVLPSLFEEQITLAETRHIHHMDPQNADFTAPLASYPAADQFSLTPDGYLEHVRHAKEAVRVPIIASLNGMTTEAWVSFAGRIQDAGADALELNIYQVTTDVTQSSIEIEANIRNVVVELKRALAIPIAVKLSPFFTAFGHVAHWLDQARADGLVIFNRFYQPDIDIHALTLAPQVELSTGAELLLRLRWLAILRRHVRCSLAATGGVATPVDGIKAILAGADAVQMVSAILRHGPGYFRVVHEGLSQWMDANAIARVDDLRGRVSLAAAADGSIFERGSYLRTLQSWYHDHPLASHTGTSP